MAEPVDSEGIVYATKWTCGAKGIMYDVCSRLNISVANIKGKDEL